MTFEEYKKKKQAEIDAFNKYKAAKYANTKPEEKPAEIKQTVKVASTQPVLPTVKVAEPTQQKVSVFVSPEEQQQRVLGRIAKSPQPNPRDVIALGAGPLSKPVIDKVLDRPTIGTYKEPVKPVATKTEPAVVVAYRKTQLPPEETIKTRIQEVEDARLNYLRQKRKQEVFDREGVPDVVEPEQEKTATREFADALVRSYYTLLKPTIGTMAESLALSPEMKKWGEEFADKTEAQLMNNPQLLPSRSKNLTNKVANIMGEMIPFMVTVSAASFVAGPVAGFSTGAAMEKSSAYRGYIENGMPPDKADTISTVYGLVASGLENSFGIKPIFVGGNKLTAETKKIFVKSFLDYVRRELPKVGMKTLKNALEEGGEEALQGIAEQIGMKYFNENANIFEGMAENFIGGAVGGGLLGGGGAIMSSAVNTNIKKPALPIREQIKTLKTPVAEIRTEPTPQAPVKPQKAITEVLEPKTTKVSPKPVKAEIKAEEPLITEAKKYKSAEEFVKAQSNAIHGTQANFTEFKKVNPKEGQAIYVSEKGGRKAQAIGSNKGKVMDVAIDESKVKTFNPRDIENKEVQQIISDVVNKKYKGKYVWSPESPVENGNKINKIGDNLAYDIIKEGNKLGYNDFRIYEPSTQEYSRAITDNSLIKTKSQLTDIWNKAQEKPVLPKKETPTITEITQSLEKETEVAEVAKLKKRKSQLEQEQKEYVKAFSETEEGAKIYQMAEIEAENASNIDFNGVIVAGIKNNPYFKKEGSIHDQMGNGYLMTKKILKNVNNKTIEQKLQIVATPEQSKSLMQKGWEKGMEIDTWAQEAGFENGNEYLEYQLAMSEKAGNLSNPEKEIRDTLMVIDPVYQSVVQEIENTKNKLKKYEQAGITKEVISTVKEGERNVKRILKEKPKVEKKTESPIINRLNKLFDNAERVNSKLDTTSHKEQLKLASDKILKDPAEAYSEAMSDKTTNKVLKTSLLGAFLEIGKQKNDTGAIAQTVMALAEHGRRSGQEIEMIRATMEGDPTNRLLYKMAETKLNGIEAKYETKIDSKAIDIVSRKKAKTKAEIREKTSFKVKDAQELLNNLMCPY